LQILEELLELWHGQGDKVLIFSISLKVLELVKEFMDDTHYTYRCLDGSVPNDQRE
jgi:SNF2 family DNA or RNA helicase